MRHSILCTLTAVSCAVALWAADASACGGCFHAPPPPTAENPEPSFVTGHRMAFAVNDTRTVLWDQFEYQGSPEDFSWVLPVKPGAYVEASTDAWFEALESVTANQVVPEPITCAGGSQSRGPSCGGGANGGTSAFAGDGSGGAFANQDPPVDVVHQGTVGPYDTVTLRSEDPDALRDWLVDHGYEIPSTIDPIIDAYVDEGWDFLALRLSPDRGVNQMTPVRVVTPGGNGILPLRMVAAGVDEEVAVTLYIIGEERYSMPDLEEASVETEKLVWDWEIERSNFLELRDEALKTNDGFTYLTVYAQPQAFVQQFVRPDTGAVVTWGERPDAQPDPSLGPGARPQPAGYASLATLYFGQAAENDRTTPCAPNARAFAETRRVVECEDAACPEINAGTMSSSAFLCGDRAHTDVEAAMIGMVPRNVWITRLDMNLPKHALGADCVVEPAAEQDSVSNWLLATKHDHPPCAPSLFTSSIVQTTPRPEPFAVVSLLGLWWLRRRRRAGAARA